MPIYKFSTIVLLVLSTSSYSSAQSQCRKLFANLQTTATSTTTVEVVQTIRGPRNSNRSVLDPKIQSITELLEGQKFSKAIRQVRDLIYKTQQSNNGRYEGTAKEVFLKKDDINRIIEAAEPHYQNLTITQLKTMLTLYAHASKLTEAQPSSEQLAKWESEYANKLDKVIAAKELLPSQLSDFLISFKIMKKIPSTYLLVKVHSAILSHPNLQLNLNHISTILRVFAQAQSAGIGFTVFKEFLETIDKQTKIAFDTQVPKIYSGQRILGVEAIVTLISFRNLRHRLSEDTLRSWDILEPEVLRTNPNSVDAISRALDFHRDVKVEGVEEFHSFDFDNFRHYEE